jgi:hypothetical protein
VRDGYLVYHRFVDGKWVTVLYIQIFVHDKGVTDLYILLAPSCHGSLGIWSVGAARDAERLPGEPFSTQYIKDSRLTVTHLLSVFSEEVIDFG